MEDHPHGLIDQVFEQPKRGSWKIMLPLWGALLGLTASMNAS